MTAEAPAAEVVATVLGALAPVTDQLPAARWSDTPDGERIDVRSYHAGPRCPAATALDGQDDFVPSVPLTTAAATAAVLDRLVNGPADPSRPGHATDPHAAFREVFADPPDDWAWRWAREEATRPERALLAAAVGRRVAGIVRLLDPWPPTGPVSTGRRTPWAHPERPLRLHGGIDLTLGRRDGTHTLVVVLPGDHTGATRRRLAYEAVVETLARRRSPAAVLALLPDAGRRWPLAVDDELLADGIAAVADAARTALGGSRLDAAGLDRRTGPACRYCEHAAGCTDGRAWLAGPGRPAFGFLDAEVERKLPPTDASD